MNTVYKTILEKLSKLMAKAEAGTATPEDFALLKEGIMKLLDRVSTLQARAEVPQQEEEVTSMPDIIDEIEEAVEEVAAEVGNAIEGEDKKEEPTPEPEPVAETPEEPAKAEVKAEETVQATAVADPASSAGQGQVEIHEKFKKEESDLSETLGQSSINDLKAAISLNDRLAYTEELFGGDKEAFDTAVRRLNDAGSFDMASEIMNKELKHKYKWDNEQLQEEFAGLVKRRYTD